MARTAYQRQLEQLRGHVRVLGEGVVGDVLDTARAIGEGREDAAREVVDGHGAAERLHRTVEDSCMSLMLLQQPLASDLRLVTAAFRAINDLARIDEMAYETALLTQELDLRSSGLAQPLSQLAGKAATMVRRAMEAFDDSDVAAAEAVFEMDDAVDEGFEGIRAAVVELLKAGEEPAVVAPEVLTVAKYYERMGDHAQAIADWAIFRATGSYRGRSMGDEG